MKHLMRLINLLSIDNNIPIRPFEEIKFPSAIDWDALDQDAAKLSADESVVFVCGEKEEQEKLVDKYQIQKLSNILNQIFDGDLYEIFFY